MAAFETAFEKFVEEQQRAASGQRLEMLKRDLTGTKKMLEAAVWPVFGSFDGWSLEHEMVSSTGVRIYGDAFYEPLRTIFESDGYASHAENITRDRFSFERMRVRTFMMHGYKYVPFSWDELDKKPDSCRRAMYELLGKYSGPLGMAHQDLSVYEREVLRCSLRLGKPFRLSDVCAWLQLTSKPGREVLRRLMVRGLLQPCGGPGRLRNHQYQVDEKAVYYI